MISVYNMASSSRVAIRTVGHSFRQPIIPSSIGLARRSYATEIEIRNNEKSSVPATSAVPEPSLYGTASARNSGQTIMKKFTGPGFPKIPVSPFPSPRFGQIK